MAKNITGKCRFCGKHKKFIEAHIIPAAFSRDVVKRKGDGKTLIEVSKKQGGKIVQSNGYRDLNILCGGCDGILGAYEGALIVFLRDSKNISRYNYRKINIAIKGILWKAHITSRPEFKDINLGKYGDKLYESLKSSIEVLDSTPPQDFPIWICRYKNDLGTENNKSDILYNMISCGSRGRDYYHGTLYRFDFTGHQIIIRVGGESLPQYINRFINIEKPNIYEIRYTYNGIQYIYNGSKVDMKNTKISILEYLTQAILY